MERGGGYSRESYGEWRRSSERPAETLKEELVRMYREAPTGLALEIIGKMILMMEAKDRANKLAQYITNADPKDISTYLPEKKIGIFLVCDTTSPKTYRVGDTVIEAGDKVMQIHIPPRTKPADRHSLMADLGESLQLTSDYIAMHSLQPQWVTGCTYDPILSFVERRYGMNAYRVSIPTEWRERVASVFHRFVDPNQEPKIGFLYSTLEQFQGRIPPRT